MSNNIYNILGKLKGITDTAAPTPDTEATTVYESVDARGSITEAVKSLEAKYQTFKEATAKPDFLDMDKDGDKKEPMKKAAKDKNNAKGAFNDMFGGDAKGLTSKLKIKEGEEITDLDAYQFAEPDTDTAVKPATAKQAAAEKRRRLQDIEDRRAEKDNWFDGKDAESNVRIHKATYQDEPEEVDEVTTATGGAVTKVGNVTTHKGKKYGGEEDKGREAFGSFDRLNKYSGSKIPDVIDPEDDDLDESIKFGDKIDNSKAEMKKAKLAKIKESRVMEETDYFYEKVAKALCGKNPSLDTAGSEFADAVRKEMVAQGIEPNRARNILLMDEDFLGDVATSYGHYCKDVVECGAPINSHLGGVSELDEIAALAGIPAPMAETDVQHEIGLERSSLEDLDEADMEEGNAFTGKLAATSPGENFKLGNKSYKDNSAIEEAGMSEGNEFSGALAAAKASGAKEFEVAGKRYTVKEDVNLNLTASGDQDVINLIARLAGIPGMEVPTPEGNPILQTQPQDLPMDAVTAIAQGVIEPAEDDGFVGPGTEVDEERDPEYVNSPREQTAGIDAAIPSGNDLHATKRAYKIAQPGDNPMAVAEAKDTSWGKYTSMLKSLLK